MGLGETPRRFVCLYSQVKKFEDAFDSALGLMLQISRVKNIGNVLKQSGVAVRLAPPYGGLLIQYKFHADGRIQ